MTKQEKLQKALRKIYNADRTAYVDKSKTHIIPGRSRKIDKKSFTKSTKKRG